VVISCLDILPWALSPVCWRRVDPNLIVFREVGFIIDDFFLKKKIHKEK